MCTVYVNSGCVTWVTKESLFLPPFIYVVYNYSIKKLLLKSSNDKFEEYCCAITVGELRIKTEE
jgi:hypothetical protein